MKQTSIRETVQKIDARLERVEQILPNLATKAELRDAVTGAIAPLATKTELREAIAEAIAPLATKTELREAIAEAIGPLATKAELREAIAEAIGPLATKAELRATAEETRRHMDVVSEATRYEVQLLADGFKAVAESQRALTDRLDRSIEEIKGVLVNHEGRLSRLEPRRRS